MLSNKLQEAMNAQINRELFSAYLYFSMAGYLERQNLPGFAAWMRAQSMEELQHALKFHDFIHDRGGVVIAAAIAKPESEFASVQEIFEKTLTHEQLVTRHINDLYALALEEKDYASQVMLQWFIEEQVEEEKTVEDILQQLKRAGDSGTALFMLDTQLGTRPSQPAAAGPAE